MAPDLEWGGHFHLHSIERYRTLAGAVRLSRHPDKARSAVMSGGGAPYGVPYGATVPIESRA